FGPDLVNWDFANYWIYVVGPLVGALSAVGVAYVLRGPGGGVGGVRAARGAEEAPERLTDACWAPYGRLPRARSDDRVRPLGLDRVLPPRHRWEDARAPPDALPDAAGRAGRARPPAPLERPPRARAAPLRVRNVRAAGRAQSLVL